MGQISAVIFDFDGVIANSDDVHIEAWSQAWHHHQGVSLSPDVKVQLRGRSTRANAKLITSQPEAKVSADELTATKQALIRKNRFKAPLIPGVNEFMAFLTKHEIPFGVASNAPRSFVEGQISMHGLAISICLGMESASNPKPSPEIFLRCATLLGISPADHDRIYVFEDSPHGIEAGVAAGMITVGVLTNYPAPELRAAGAVLTIQDFFDPQLAAIREKLTLG